MGKRKDGFKADYYRQINSRQAESAESAESHQQKQNPQTQNKSTPQQMGLLGNSTSVGPHIRPPATESRLSYGHIRGSIIEKSSTFTMLIPVLVLCKPGQSKWPSLVGDPFDSIVRKIISSSPSSAC